MTFANAADLPDLTGFDIGPNNALESSDAMCIEKRTSGIRHVGGDYIDRVPGGEMVEKRRHFGERRHIPVQFSHTGCQASAEFPEFVEGYAGPPEAFYRVRVENIQEGIEGRRTRKAQLFAGGREYRVVGGEGIGDNAVEIEHDDAGGQVRDSSKWERLSFPEV